MTIYKKIHTDEKPQEVEITEAMVFLAKNIKQFTNIIDDHEVSGYEYDCFAYTKDEYIHFLAEQNTSLQNELLDTQAALCDVYELIEGGIE